MTKRRKNIEYRRVRIIDLKLKNNIIFLVHLPLDLLNLDHYSIEH